MTFTKGQKLEQVTSEGAVREEFDVLVDDASEDFGGFLFLSRLGLFLRQIEFVFLSMFSEHFATRRFLKAVR
jgi:hypothetical protein